MLLYEVSEMNDYRMDLSYNVAKLIAWRLDVQVYMFYTENVTQRV